MVTDAVKSQLKAAMVAKCQQLDVEVIAIELMPDHSHLLVQIPATLPVATLVKEVKGASSHFVNKVLAPDFVFKWQGAYGAFTVGADGVQTVKRYITNQQRHHADGNMVNEWEPGGTSLVPPRISRGD